jgi:hypothetical protein
MTVSFDMYDWDDSTTVDCSETDHKWKIIVEARPGYVLVIYGPYGGVGSSVAEAMDEVLRRMRVR